MFGYQSFYELAAGSVRQLTFGHPVQEDMCEENTQSYIEVINRTWESIRDRENALEFGATLYREIVNLNVEIAVLFANTQFENQSSVFVQMMGASIEWLTADFSLWRAKMTPVAQRHVSYGVKPEHYKYFRKAFMVTIRRFVDPWSEENEDAWIWYWSCIMGTLGFATQSTLLETVAVSREEHVQKVTTLHTMWTLVSEDPLRFGETFYETLFATDSDMVKLFSSIEMRRQGVRFFAMLNHAVRQMDNTTGFEDAMIKLTYQHKVYGVTLDHVDSFGVAFESTLSTILSQETFSNEYQDAVQWFWGRIRQCFEYGLAHTYHFAETPRRNSDQILLSDPRARVLRTLRDSSQNETRGSSDGGLTSSTLGGGNADADVSTARIFQPTFSLTNLKSRR